MYRLGYCDHYLSLRRTYPRFFDKTAEWTLKGYGSLFAYDTIIQLKARRVLEIGPGFNNFFATQMAELGVEYWYCDKGGSGLGIGADADRWNQVVAERESKGARLVPCLMGEDDPRLPDGSFDCVFSISVLEHVPDDAMKSVARDVRRVLKSGGVSSHSIDIYPQSKKSQLWHAAIEAAGMEVPQPHYLNWDLKGPHTTFLESQRIRYFMYHALAHKDPIRAGVKYNHHFATVLHQGFAK